MFEKIFVAVIFFISFVDLKGICPYVLDSFPYLIDFIYLYLLCQHNSGGFVVAKIFTHVWCLLYFSDLLFKKCITETPKQSTTAITYL